MRYALDNNEVKVGDFKPAGPDPNVVDDERKVWGLIQTSGSDGDAVGVTGAENLRILFVYVDSTDNIAVATVKAGDYEFRYRKVNARRFEDPNLSEDGADDTERDVLDIAKALIPQITMYIRFTAVTVPGTIDLLAPAGFVISGDLNAKLPGTLLEFQTNGKVSVKDNGIELPKEDVGAGLSDWIEYASSTSFNTKRTMDPGDVITITVPKSY